MWVEYERWNKAVAEVIFARSDEARPVYLDIEDDLIEQLAERLNVTAESAADTMCDAVRLTLDRSTGPGNVFAEHDRKVRAWIKRGRSGTPPMLALLAAFSLAAERMTTGDGMTANNYFGRLRRVLRWADHDPALDVAYRRVAERYWNQLNLWLVQEQGARGIPTAFALSHRYVGLSVSQALVRRGDREKLKDFFQTFGFVPGSQVAPGDLIPLLDSWIKQPNSPVTASLIRLWGNGQARARIAEAAAVTLAAWDGTVIARSAETGEGAARLLLTLELGGFPRRRFAISALFYVPEPARGRGAEVSSADPPAAIDLIPDVPGALGLAPGTSLHSGDVLTGVLRVRDSLTGTTMERRPRRLVTFREDELSRRWVEVQQVMLGDDLRVLVEQGLSGRVAEILRAIARPGWALVDPYPGQPEGWSLFTGVEILNHPGSLIPANKMDDLAALIPLTSSTLRISGGFAIPGTLRGKWHAAAPPEIRAVSDSDAGFTVRLMHLDRDDELSEQQVAEWSDNGSGVVIESLHDLEVCEGDYRVEVVPAGSVAPTSSTMIYLRSGESRDERQWHLAESISYGPGIGALGVDTHENGGLTIQGHDVHSYVPPASLGIAVPPLWPSWSETVGSRRLARQPMRVTVPHADSCIRSGRHNELIDTVKVDFKGRPLKSWCHGRCQTCGLVKRYPTRPKKRKWNQPEPESQEAHVLHDLSAVTPTGYTEGGRDWSVAFDALMHLGGGTWGALEKVALQIEPSGLFVDQFARTLEVLGHISIRRDAATLRPVAWELSPTQLSGVEASLAFTGYWPASLFNEVADALDEDGIEVWAEGDEPSQCFMDSPTLGAAAREVVEAYEISVFPDAWRNLALALPPLSEVFADLPRQAASADGEISWFDVQDALWKRVDSYEAPGAYRVRKFSTLDIVRADSDVSNGTYARCTVQLGKHIAALMARKPLVAHNPATREFMVPVGAELPGLYGRALVAASCRVPEARRGAIIYTNVPAELAAHIFHLLAS